MLLSGVFFFAVLRGGSDTPAGDGGWQSGECVQPTVAATRGALGQLLGKPARGISKIGRFFAAKLMHGFWLLVDDTEEVHGNI